MSFSEAAAVISAERSEVTKCLVALDQPTIVPNLSGSRPVDKVAAALISWVGGGVQPANRSKMGMFDDAAPIWRFKQAIGAIEDPEAARAASSGLFLIEVFPALALVAIESAYCQRYGAPKYNPANRKMFRLEHWHSVAETIRTFGSLKTLDQLELWCSDVSANLMPRKADQDKIDAMICGLIGLHWLVAPREQSVMIGDLDNGYMIAPAVNGIHKRLVTAARKRNVPIR
ncbi:UNVERIFIED_ORG: putative RNase H-like nuclease [Rhizobium esperanzae]